LESKISVANEFLFNFLAFTNRLTFAAQGDCGELNGLLTVRPSRINAGAEPVPAEALRHDKCFCQD